MIDGLFDLVAGDGEISSRVEGVGLFGEDAANARGDRETDVGVYVDLADRH